MGRRLSFNELSDTVSGKEYAINECYFDDCKNRARISCDGEKCQKKYYGQRLFCKEHEARLKCPKK